MARVVVMRAGGCGMIEITVALATLFFMADALRWARGDNAHRTEAVAAFPVHLANHVPEVRLHAVRQVHLGRMRLAHRQRAARCR